MEEPIDPKTLADQVLQAALDKKAFDPLVLEVGDLVGYADYFVIVSARSPRQVRAIANAARTALKAEGLTPLGVEGRENATWMLVDFNDVVLHVFHDEVRRDYDLEDLYAAAPRSALPEGATQAHPIDLDDDDDDDDTPLFSIPDV